MSAGQRSRSPADIRTCRTQSAQLINLRDGIGRGRLAREPAVPSCNPQEHLAQLDGHDTVVRPVWRTQGGVVEICGAMRAVRRPMARKACRAILDGLPDEPLARHDRGGRPDPLKLTAVIGPNSGTNGRISMHGSVVDDLRDRQTLTFGFAARLVVHGEGQTQNLVLLHRPFLSNCRDDCAWRKPPQIFDCRSGR